MLTGALVIVMALAVLPGVLKLRQMQASLRRARSAEAPK